MSTLMLGFPLALFVEFPRLILFIGFSPFFVFFSLRCQRFSVSSFFFFCFDGYVMFGGRRRMFLGRFGSGRTDGVENGKGDFL